MRLWLLITTTVALVVSVALYMDARSRPIRLPEQEPAHSGPLPIYASGRIEGATEPLELRAELAGTVRAVHCVPGDRVERGTVLVELDRSELEARLLEARAAAEAATARLAEIVNGPRPEELEAARQRMLAARARAKLFETRYRRLVALWERNGARREEVDDEQQRYLAAAAELAAATAEYELLQAGARVERRQAAEAEVAAAQARVRELEALLEKTFVRAPVDGIVVEVNCRVGEVTGPTTALPAVVMVDNSQPRVRAFVEEYDVARVRPGMLAKITVDGLPGMEYRGRVTAMNGIVRQKTLVSFEPGERYDTRVLEVWIDLEESPGLPVGLRVDVTIDPSALTPIANEGDTDDRVVALGEPGGDGGRQ